MDDGVAADRDKEEKRRKAKELTGLILSVESSMLTVMFLVLIMVYPIAQGYCYLTIAQISTSPQIRTFLESGLGSGGLGLKGVGVSRSWMWMVRQLYFPLGTDSLYFLLISFAVELIGAVVKKKAKGVAFARLHTTEYKHHHLRNMLGWIFVPAIVIALGWIVYGLELAEPGTFDEEG